MSPHNRCTLCCLILSTLAAASIQAGPPAQSSTSPVPQEMDLRAYIAELNRWSGAIAAAQRNPSQLPRLRESLPASWSIRAGEQHWNVSTRWLDDALESAQEDQNKANAAMQGIEQKLAALRESAESLESSAASAGPEQARARLDRILRAREFSGMSGPTWIDLLKVRIADWIFRQLGRVFRRLHLRTGAGNFVVWTLIAAAFLLLAYWVRQTLSRSSRQAQMDLSGAQPVGLDSREWLRNARAAAERGDYRQAIHAAYWAAIARLEELHALPQDRSRTPRESLRLLGPGNAHRAPLAELTRHFELVWYGYRPATAVNWNEAVTLLEKMGCLPRSTLAIAGS